MTQPSSDPVPPRTRRVRNVLFIMSDQLRWDHLSCAGHPVLQTPHLDALAARGVRFDRAYVQSAICVPSRMSFYTGRYVSSHGATWVHVPFPVSQPTLGEHLRRAGMDIALAGKSHVNPDTEGLARFGVDPDSDPGRLLLRGGFRELDRYDGHAPPRSESGYADYLRAHGYASADPWNDFVVSAHDASGRKVSGWYLRNAHLPALVAEEHSETAYMTDRALDYIRAQGETPWVLHLSYIKPHWPLMAPAPYHAMYRDADTGPIVRPDRRTENPHPVLDAYRATHDDCLSHQDEAHVRHFRPTYMGLVKQLDDHIGRLMAELERLGRLDDTLIIFTADHGDHLGDRGLGEKEFFFDQSTRVPFFVVDPDPAADATRGTVDRRLVEGVDVVPTILEALHLDPARHVVEGRSLLPLLRGSADADWRDAAFSEMDYAFREARRHLDRGAEDCYAWMVCTERWKYGEFKGLRPQLFDLQEDPQELTDRGDDPALGHVRREMRDRLLEWFMGLKRRTAVDHGYVERRTEDAKRNNIPIGIW